MSPSPVPVRIIESGRVTVPEDVREELGVEKGDTLVASFRRLDPDIDGEEVPPLDG